jgi:hypothetical protein
MRVFTSVLVATLVACATRSTPFNDPVTGAILDLRREGFPPAAVLVVNRIFSQRGGLQSVNLYKLGGREVVAQGAEWRDPSGRCFIEFEPASGEPAMYRAMTAGCGWRSRQDACDSVYRWTQAAAIPIQASGKSMPCVEGLLSGSANATTLTAKIFRGHSEWRSTVNIRNGDALISTE